MSSSQFPTTTILGIRHFYQDAPWNNTLVRVQILGIYRYLVDPVLKEQLGWPFTDTRDVFDVVLSDGQYKVKAVLSPTCYHLVWTRKLGVFSMIQVTNYKVLKDTNTKQKRRILVLEEVTVTSSNNEGKQSPTKFSARRNESLCNGNKLEFISTVHPRETDLLPLIGQRVYYCPLWSDDYTLDWACSFTAGVPEEDSPLDELINNFASRYSDDPDTTEGCNDTQEAVSSSVVAWSVNPEYCLDLFTPEYKKVFEILEAVKLIMQDEQKGSCNLYPPMLGAIRVKSKLMNMGDPDIANPFPFAFNAVVVDANGAFEVMFFGSVCAKYFLSIQEGDLIQFRGYSTISPQKLQWTKTTSPLLYYEHGSSGSALHVPQKYWKLLEMTTMGPHLISDDIIVSKPRASPCKLPQLRPSWLECSFVTTLNTLYWGKNTVNSLDMMYFDFVGVLSYVGKICRSKRKLSEEGSEMTMYRWVKMIDSSSSHELVIRLSECSQPTAFRSLEAGETLMVTKLQWTMLPEAGISGERIQYATTSVFSIFRMNEDVIPFHSIEECNLNMHFAESVRKYARYVSCKATGESKLTAYMETNYHPRNRLPTDVNAFKKAFDLKVYSFSDLKVLLQHMEAYEYQHVGFIGQVSAIRSDNDSTKGGRSVLLELNESKNIDQTLAVAVTINELYQTTCMKGNVEKVTPLELLPLVRILPSAIVDDVYVKAVEERPARSTRPTSPGLSLSLIEEYLISSKRDYFFSLQLYHDGIGRITWEVDAILAMP
ncbi:unnamed protein product [Peronospora belbahrii]|uniref:Telomeric single stranded DNA binding POT1/Cdc13 domain-containing protein n=1 Tax=Peronospora belbahrii TaxID=622444 RepID=A0AAU9KPQ3_9STRA|nr:unnamed protein product [Peronospora belbahrii]CAH0519907.1 unnamed protein product [Peronospora belbahrii]